MALNIKQYSNFSDKVKNGTVTDGYIELELGNVIKFGYTCEEKGMEYPIYLKMNGVYEKFKIGKTNIFEISTDVGITHVKVPVNIKFTVDYITKGE